MLNGKRWSVAVGGSLLVLSLVWGQFGVSPAEGADLPNGQKVYEAKCLRCHGKEGKGDGPKAAELDKKPRDFTNRAHMAEHSDADLKKAVIEGKPPMPSFKGKLKDKDIQDVIAYIKIFAARAGK